MQGDKSKGEKKSTLKTGQQQHSLDLALGARGILNKGEEALIRHLRGVGDLLADVEGVEEGGDSSLVGRDLGLLHDGDIGADIGDEGELDSPDLLNDIHHADQDVGDNVRAKVGGGLINATVAGGDVGELLLEIVTLVGSNSPVGLSLVIAHVSDGLGDGRVSGDGVSGSGRGVLTLETKARLLHTRVHGGGGSKAPLLFGTKKKNARSNEK